MTASIECGLTGTFVVHAHIYIPVVSHVQPIEIFSFVLFPEDFVGVEDQSTAPLLPFQFDFVFEEVRRRSILFRHIIVLSFVSIPFF